MKSSLHRHSIRWLLNGLVIGSLTQMAVADKPVANDALVRSRVTSLVKGAILPYTVISSIHSKATTIQEFNTALFNQPPRDVKMSSTYEYWRQNNRFRIESKFDKLEAPGTDETLTFDGTEYRCFTPANSMLSIWVKRASGVSALPSNPLLSACSFMWLEDDGDKPPPFPEWDDLSKAELIEKRVKEMSVVSDTDKGLVISAPGGNVDGVDFRFVVAFNPQGSLQKIDRVAVRSGKLITSTELEYQNVRNKAGAFVQLPRRTTTVMYESGKVAGRETSTIEILEVDTSLPQSLFSYDLRKAKTVFDLDNRKIGSVGRKPTTNMK